MKVVTCNELVARLLYKIPKIRGLKQTTVWQLRQIKNVPGIAEMNNAQSVQLHTLNTYTIFNNKETVHNMLKKQEAPIHNVLLKSSKHPFTTSCSKINKHPFTTFSLKRNKHTHSVFFKNTDFHDCIIINSTKKTLR